MYIHVQTLRTCLHASIWSYPFMSVYPCVFFNREVLSHRTLFSAVQSLEDLYSYIHNAYQS